MPLPDAIAASEAFRKALVARERQAATRLVRAYGSAYQRLQTQIEGLTAELDRLAEKGELSPAKVGRLARLKGLKAQIESEVNRYGAYAEQEVEQGVRAAMAQGQADAKALTQVSLPGLKPLDAAIMGQWQQLRPEAVEALLGFTDKRSPLMTSMATLRDNLGKPVAERVGEKLVQGVALGYNPRKVAGIIRRELGQGLTWSLQTARTAQLNAYREGTRAAYVANQDIVPRWRWSSSRGVTTCASCIAMDGTTHPVTERLNDHHNGRCLAPGTFVSGPAVVAFVSRDYKGDMVRISTASGQLLAVTPNHPILTDAGWVAAGLLHKGSNVVRYLGQQGTAAGVGPDKYEVPTRVEDIPTTHSMYRLGSVPTAAEDFHGDGVGSDVHVVWSNCKLCDRYNAAISQPFFKYLFGKGTLVTVGLSCPGSCDAFAEWYGSASASLLRGEHTVASLLGRHVHRLEAVRLSQATPADAPLVKAVLDNSATDTEVRGKGLLGLAGKVTLDEIVNVEVYAFHGPVYNLQTVNGWFSASNIITHNCAMVPVPVTYRELGLDVDEPAPVLEHPNGEAWLRAQPESTQKKILGEGKYEAWQEGKFDFAQLSQETTDPVWGSIRVEAPLKDLVSEPAA